MHFQPLLLVLKVLDRIYTIPPEDAVDDEVDAAVDGDEEVVALGQGCHLLTKVLKYLDRN